MSEPSGSHHEEKVSRRRQSAPSLGCVGGGCLLPILLFLFSAAMGDTGGPLIWPLAVMLFGFLGLLTGIVIRDLSNHKR